MSEVRNQRISFIERTLFSFTRAFSITGSVIAVLGFAFSILLYLSIGAHDTHISHEQVMRALHPPKEAESSSLQSAVPELKIPANIEKYMGDKNRKIFLGWIEDLDEGQRKEFISNLSEVINAAEHQSWFDRLIHGPKVPQSDVFDVINKFKELKLEKLHENQIEKYANRAAKAAAIGFTLAMVMLVAMMSLVLVMLAIERNTRTAPSNANAVFDRVPAAGNEQG